MNPDGTRVVRPSTVNKIFLVAWLASFFCVSEATHASQEGILSNGLVELRIDSEAGTYDLIDLKRNAVIIGEAQIGFSVAPYVELVDVAEDAFETELKAVETQGQACLSRVTGSFLAPEFGQGKSLTMVSQKAGVGQLYVQFTLYPQKTFCEIGFAFKNLGQKPIRLRRANVIDCRQFMAGCDRDMMQLLNGGSGIKRTMVVRRKEMTAENNMLCFFADRKQPRALTAGGLTYADFRKYVRVNGASLVMYADDPVGRRVDPGQMYESADKFYVDGQTDNPFESLEAYAACSQEARAIDLHYYTFPSTCMWFLAVNHFGADTGSTNSTVGAVQEAERIAQSGFLKYSPVGVRLVPDNYEQNNQQGWWDDEHWQMYGRKRRCVVDRHYAKPYETTKKWATKVRQLGSIPLTYFQPGIRSEDYAEAFPGHMLYNQAHKYIKKDGKIVGDPHWVMGDRGIPDVLNPGKWHAGYGKRYQEAYDYTDPEFARHWTEVNRALKDGGVQGVFYDYPDRAFPRRGGMEDRYATATAAYRQMYRIAREQQGEQAYLQERLGPGSDATLDHVSSVRTAGDTNVINPKLLDQVAVRWYKNRRLTNYDMDGKALLRYGHGKDIREVNPVLRRAILTLTYTVSGRMLLTESFRLFPEDVLHDLSRVFPFHATPLTARPLDVFINGMPSVFDFPISPDWHQVVLYGSPGRAETFTVPISGDTAFGALGLDADRSYYVYDFWNDRFAGKVPGHVSIKQSLSPGQARMLSVHAVQDHPQWISTDRHVMQGYVDLVEKPQWDGAARSLEAVSDVIENEPYNVVIALNGHGPEKVEVDGARAIISARRDNPNLADLRIESATNARIRWRVTFSK